MSNHYFNESGGGSWGYLDDWFADLESKQSTGLAEYGARPEGWTAWNEKGAGTGGYEDFLKDLYNEQMASMDVKISFHDFKAKFSGLFDTYDSTMEELKEEAFATKVQSTEEEFTMLKEHQGEELALYEKYYGMDSEDDFESIAELKERQIQENIVLDKKSERQKIINAGVNYTLSRDKILADSIKTGLRHGNTETIVEDLTTEFWSKMKVVRNEYEKNRLKQVQSIDSLILKSSQKLEDKEFKVKQTLEEAFVSAESNIKEGALGLLIDKLDLKDQFEEDTWETMGYLAGSDALVGCYGVECPDGQKCIGSGQCVDAFGEDDPNQGDGIASDHTPCTENQLANDCVTRTKIEYGQSSKFTGYQTTETEVEYCDCRPHEGYDSHCCTFVPGTGSGVIPGGSGSAGYYTGTCCPEGEGEGEIINPPSPTNEEHCIDGGGSYIFKDPGPPSVGSWCCDGGTNDTCTPSYPGFG